MPLLAKTGSSLSSSPAPPNSTLTRSTTASWSRRCGGTAVASAARRGSGRIVPPRVAPRKRYDIGYLLSCDPVPDITTSRGHAAGTKNPSRPITAGRGSVIVQLIREPIELGRVLAGDLVDLVGGQVGELLLDKLVRFRPHTVGVRVVGTPHHRFEADIVDQLGADAVELEGALAVAAPVFARLQLHQVAEAVLELEIHPVERVGEPAGAALAKADPQGRIAVEHAGADHRRNDVDQPHLERRHAGEHRRAPDLRAGLGARFRVGGWEGVEMQRQVNFG